MSIENYKYMVKASTEQLKSEKNLIANLANISAYINEFLDDVNWVGFYILIEDELVLGPFQGKPACVRLKPGRGVCFTAVETKKTVIVDDVNSFEGHIACDSDSNSEIVVPIMAKGNVVGVLDVDSASKGRFKNEEKNCLEKIVKEIEKYLIL
ncbi:MAG: GAF domain-containing protein [Clostridium sp.]|uniref:GAF domain-containing protein n=1 Tax=Clostridium sp. TaxID=1506 RepID=UPI003F2B8F8C